MANLYCKVKSDIRAGTGCRGKSHLDAVVNFSYDGKNKPDGLVVLRARHHGDSVEMVVDAYPRVQDTHPTRIVKLTLHRNGTVERKEGPDEP